MKNLARNEKGAALILALILLLIGGLISAALLNHMGSGILLGVVHERRTAELYAADAGVEDAIWKIQNQVPEVAQLYQCDDSWSYNITDAEGRVAEVNYKHVEVTITVATVLNNLPSGYRIVSRAIGDGNGNGGIAAIDSATAIEAYVNAAIKSSGILDHVIVTPCEYAVTNPTQIDPLEGAHAPEAYYAGEWPTVEMLSDLYWEDVKDAVPYYVYEDLYIQDYTASGIGPLYTDGSLDIKNKGSKEMTVKLMGTVYVTGDLTIGASAVGQNFTLDLNGQTIFVESATGAAPEGDPCNPGTGDALIIGGGCTLTGSGCIIAVGNIDFMPNLNCNEKDYILVLSVDGKTYMHPNGDFYGTLAGSSEVYVQNGDAIWTDYSNVEGGINFPDLSGVKQVSSCSIESWEIIQQ